MHQKCLSTAGFAQFVGNWNSTNYWGIGPATSASDKTIRIGNTSDKQGTWSATQDLNLLVGGNVGIGTTSPGTTPLYVSTTATSGNIATFVSTGAGGAGCSIAWNGASCSSDIRLKENITSIDSSNLLDDLLKVRPVHFTWKKDSNHEKQTGFIAQELEKIFPEFVKTDTNGYKQVNYAHFVSVLTSGLQELFKRSQIVDRKVASVEAENAKIRQENVEIKIANAALKEKVDKTEQENAKIKARLERIEKMLLSK